MNTYNTFKIHIIYVQNCYVILLQLICYYNWWQVVPGVCCLVVVVQVLLSLPHMYHVHAVTSVCCASFYLQNIVDKSTIVSSCVQIWGFVLLIQIFLWFIQDLAHKSIEFAIFLPPLTSLLLFRLNFEFLYFVFVVILLF